MNLQTFSFVAAVTAIVALSPAVARADAIGGCGSHHQPRVVTCAETNVGGACDTASTTDGTGGTCQSICGDAGTSDAGADCTLTCVPTMHGALTPRGGAWKYFAPWALALVVPVALRKRRRA